MINLHLEQDDPRVVELYDSDLWELELSMCHKRILEAVLTGEGRISALNSLLSLASFRRDIEMLRYLLGFDFASPVHLYNLLAQALNLRSEDIAILLFEDDRYRFYGQYNCTDEERRIYIFRYACQYGNVDFVKVVLKRITLTEIDKGNCLREVVISNEIIMFKLLVEELKISIEKLEQCYVIALERDYLEIVTFLAENYGFSAKKYINYGLQFLSCNSDRKVFKYLFSIKESSI